MSKIQGTISNDCKKKGTYGWHIMLEEKDGFYLNTKFEPKCGRGDVVGVEYEQKKENAGNIKRLVVLEDNGGQAAASSSASEWNDAPKSAGKAPPAGNRQDSIVWQSSRKDALVLASLLVETKTFKVPAGDKGRVAIEGLIDEVTYTFFNAANDPRNCEAFVTNTEVDEDASEPVDKTDTWDTGEGTEKWED
jgi:hypothetical protein